MEYTAVVWCAHWIGVMRKNLQETKSTGVRQADERYMYQEISIRHHQGQSHHSHAWKYGKDFFFFGLRWGVGVSEVYGLELWKSLFLLGWWRRGGGRGYVGRSMDWSGWSKQHNWRQCTSVPFG
jgi:hypothetical protein